MQASIAWPTETPWLPASTTEAMFLPEICIKRPVLATVLSLSLLAVGVVGYSRLPVRELPAVDFPVICSRRYHFIYR